MAAAALALLGVLGGAALALAFGLNALRERDRAEAALEQARATHEALARVFAAGNPAIAGEPDVSFRRVLAAAPAQIDALPAHIRLPVLYTVALAQAQSGDEQAAIAGFAAVAALAEDFGADALWTQAQLRRAMLAAEHFDTAALTADIDALLVDPRTQADPLVRAGLLTNAAALAVRTYRTRTASTRLAEARAALGAARGRSAVNDPTLAAEIEIDLLTTVLEGIGSGVEDALTPAQLLAEASAAHARLAPLLAGDHPKPAALSVLAAYLSDAIAGHAAWRDELLSRVDAQIPRLGLTHPAVQAQLRTGAAMSLLQAITDAPLQRRLLDVARALPAGSRRRLRLLLEAANETVYASAIGATSDEIAAARAATCAAASRDGWECTWAEVVLAERAILEGQREQIVDRLEALVRRATTLPSPLDQHLLSGAAFVYGKLGDTQAAIATAEQALRALQDDPELSTPQRDQLILRLSWLFRPSRCDRVLELIGPMETRLSRNPAVAGDVLARLLSTCEVRAGKDPGVALARLAPWWQRAQDPAVDRMVQFEVISAYLEIHDVLGREDEFARWASLLAELETAMPTIRTLQLDHMTWVTRARALQSGAESDQEPGSRAGRGD
jgi:tetratricopeptide (TPR) repeat protein